MIHWIMFWQYDWCGHPTISQSSMQIPRNFAFVDFPVWWMLCYCLCSLEKTQQMFFSEHSMIICLHRTSLVLLSCHFRYFVVILFSFEKCNILLNCLQIRCILNMLLHVVHLLLRRWIGLGPRTCPCVTPKWRYDRQNEL